MSTHRLTRRIPLMAFAALLAGSSTVALAAPTHAVAGMTTRQVISVHDSTAEKVVRVACPSGTSAVGGSAVVGGTTAVRINTEVPDATGYTVLAREQRGGTTESWSVVVTALCAPASSLPGLEYRRVASSFDSSVRHSVSAACSPGKKLVGLGGLIDSNGPGQDRLVLAAIRPADDLGGVVVTGLEDEVGYAGGWRATAVAVCTSPAAGLKLATGTTAVDSTGFKQSIAVCPAGTRIHAGGFDLGTAVGQANLTSSFLDVDVNSDPTRQGFEAQAREDGTGYSGIWRLGTWAICAS
jgi:hypothetical protein